MPLDASCAEMLNNLASEVSGAFMLPNSSWLATSHLKLLFTVYSIYAIATPQLGGNVVVLEQTPVLANILRPRARLAPNRYVGATEQHPYA